MDQFTEDEKEILKPFFTNLDKPIFALVNLPEVVKGALFSRYSRSAKSLRKILLDEFIKAPEMGFKEIVGFQTGQGVNQLVAIQKAEEFYDRVLVGYGDDSVAELGGASIAVEDVSNICSKVLEDARIGLSPLEKSTRYVFFNDKVDGKFRYYRDSEIMNSKFADLFVQTCDMLFETYGRLNEPMTKWVVERFPKGEEVSDRAYNASVRSKVLDILRNLLPAATLTNVGIFGNGRGFEYLITKMYAHQLREMRDVAEQMRVELSKVIPSFVKRANDRYGLESQKFMSETREGTKKITEEFLSGIKSDPVEPVELVKWDSEAEAETKVIAAIMYQYSQLPMRQLLDVASKMPEENRKKILHEFLSRRSNRRNKPGRAFENVHYTFDILGNYGMFRELHRHRMLTQERQDLTVKHGYDTPKEIIQTGFQKEYDEAMKAAADAFEKISAAFPKQAQYIVPMGFRIRWYFTMSLREVYYLTELRTTPQGHPDYRRVAQMIFQKAREVHPNLMEFAKFVDMKDYPLERLASEMQTDKKIEELKKKYGS